MNTITPVIGYQAIYDFIEYLQSVAPEDIADDLTPSDADFSRDTVLQAGLFHATAMQDAAEIEDIAFRLSELAEFLPSIAKTAWYPIAREGGSCRDFEPFEDEITRTWESHCAAVASSACHLLFNDVPTLFEFHSKLAAGNRTRDLRTPRRYMPSWVKKAVYHRDRGICHWCSKSVGAYDKETQFDHMIPLAAFGVNDVSNIVLSCGSCNRRKSKKARRVHRQIFHW
jgi:hypothetical protein